jgi:hypothetical protein
LSPLAARLRAARWGPPALVEFDGLSVLGLLLKYAGLRNLQPGILHPVRRRPSRHRVQPFFPSQAHCGAEGREHERAERPARFFMTAGSKIERCRMVVFPVAVEMRGGSVD